MMRTVFTLLVAMSFVCIIQTPTNSADYDASGLWDIVTPWETFTMNIVQYPDDTFGLQIDTGYTPDINYLYWSGIITGNHYEVTDCRFEDLQPLSTAIPGHEDTGFFTLYPPTWFISDTTSYSFDLSSQNVLSGSWYCVNSGWKSPILTFEPSSWEYDPGFEGLPGGFSFEGTKQPCEYCASANAEASVYGAESLTTSGSLNALALLIVPVGAVTTLRIWRRKR